MIEKLDTGMGARLQPLMYETTTAGVSRTSVCYLHWDFSVKMLEGVIPQVTADRWFAYIATIDEGDDWQDELAWRKANPSLGDRSLQDRGPARRGRARAVDAVAAELDPAPAAQPVDPAARALDPDGGLGATGPSRSTPRRCGAGGASPALDLARINDLSSLALLFPPVSDGERWKVLWRHWCPADNIEERSRRDRAPYLVWRDQGHLIATEGNTTDFKFVEAAILELASGLRHRKNWRSTARSPARSSATWRTRA